MSTVEIEKFVQRWGGDAPDCAPLLPAQLDEIEASVGVDLPKSYRLLLESFGAPSLGLAVLDAVLEQGLDLADLQEFLGPASVIETTLLWREIGLGSDFVAFAAQGAGDLFCFRCIAGDSPEIGESNVWYFNHEEREIYDLECTFSAWLETYARIARPVV